jgi:hypothetical protein
MIFFKLQLKRTYERKSVPDSVDEIQTRVASLERKGIRIDTTETYVLTISAIFSSLNLILEHEKIQNKA